MTERRETAAAPVFAWTIRFSRYWLRRSSAAVMRQTRSTTLLAL